MAPIKILFVCLGNIVRSPLGEHMFKDLAEKKGLGNRYITDSAGTSAYHVGESPDKRMRQVSAEFGLIYDGAARQFRFEDFDNFDLIIPMDTENRENILRMTGDPASKMKVHLMRNFEDNAGENASVPDPYYDGIDGFYNVYEIVMRSCENLLEAIENGEIQFSR